MQNSVIIIAERFYPEEFGINDLALSWAKRGYKVTVLTQVPSYPYDKIYPNYSNKFFQSELWNGIKIYRVWTQLGYHKSWILKVTSYIFFAILTSFFSFFIQRRANKIFVYQTGPLTQILPAIVLKWIFKKSIYLWILDLWPDSVYAYGFKKNNLNNYLLSNFVRFAYTSCSHILVSNEGFIPKVKELCTGKPISYIPQWVPLDLNFSNATNIPKMFGAINFTFAGNIGKVQNLENLILGFSKIKTDKNVIFNIIGGGSNLKILKKFVESLSMKNIIFWGKIPLTEMPNWLFSSDVLIISLIDRPNFSLTVPGKFQAYLAAGKPIFCCMKGETARLVQQHALGITCDPENLEEIENTFINFIELSKAQHSRFANNSKRIIETNYTFKNIELKIESIIFN